MTLEFSVSGNTYRAGKLDAKRQFHVVRRLAPLLSGLLEGGLFDAGKPSPLQNGLANGQAPGTPAAVGDVLDPQAIAFFKPVLERIATLPDADVDYVLHSCLMVVERQQVGGGWARVMLSGERLMFEDLDMQGMLQIAWRVLQDSLSGFFDGLPRSSPGEART